ncbi:MAG: WXG100 family type VII secretion target [Oscillospiraceae bacterium]
MGLDDMLNGIANYVNQGTVKFDESQMKDVRSRLVKVSSSVENTTQHVTGVISEAQSVWSGAAADKFFESCAQLMKSSNELVGRINTNINSLDSAIAILSSADDKVQSNVEKLGTANIFKNK